MLQPHPIPSRNGRGDQYYEQKSERPRRREEENVDEQEQRGEEVEAQVLR